MEIWKTIEGYKKYQISNLGRVKSLCFGKEKILKNCENANGYLHVTLKNKTNKKTKKIHQLVAIAFLNHKPCGHKLVVNHKNFIKKDNRVENLEIVTQRENGNLKHIKSASKYVGVSWHKRDKKWRARIVINKKSKHLGCYETEEEASFAYQQELQKINKI